MLYFSGRADDRGLTISFDGLATTGHLQDFCGQGRAELRGDGVDLGLEVLDEALSMPGIGQDGSCREQREGPAGGTSSFDQGLLDIGDDLAKLSHVCPSISVGRLVYHNMVCQSSCLARSSKPNNRHHGTIAMMNLPLDEAGLRVDRTAKTLREQTVERLRDAILNFQFKAGERLVERSLCEKLGVSRTVVREALRHLEAEGLVEVLPQQGPAVAKPDISQVAQVYEIRALLEAEAARSAAMVANEADISRLTEANQAIQVAFAAGTSRDILKATTDFYKLLFTIAGKSVAWQLVQGLNARVNYLRAMTISRPNRSVEANAEMLRIVEAIARKDGKAAAKASFDHVEQVKKLAMTMLESAR